MPRTLPVALLALLAGLLRRRASGRIPGLSSPWTCSACSGRTAPAVSPDGRSVVYSRRAFDVRTDGRRSGLWLVDTASGAARPLTAGTGNEGQAAWSPDGKRLAYVASDGSTQQIHVRYMDTGASVRLTQLTEGPDGLSWSPGRTLDRVQRPGPGQAGQPRDRHADRRPKARPGPRRSR